MTLHLSPTSTANVSVTSVLPSAPPDVAFLKLAPDAEVVVAPKVRPRLSRSNRTDTSSIASTGRRSAAGRSQAGSTRHRHSKTPARKAMYLRCLDESVICDVEGRSQPSQTISVSVDGTVLAMEPLHGVQYVCVSVVSPSTINIEYSAQQRPNSHEKEREGNSRSAARIVAKLLLWVDAPDPKHTLLSPYLASILGLEHNVGGILRIEPAPPPSPKSAIVGLTISPFLPPGSSRMENLKFGGETKASREAVTKLIRSTYGRESHQRLLAGPLTHGLILLPLYDGSKDWYGGLLHIKQTSTAPQNPGTASWTDGENCNLPIEVLQSIPSPMDSTGEDYIPVQAPLLAGSDKIVKGVVKGLLHGSSVLVAGGLGIGKTSISLAIAHFLRKDHLAHAIYFSCRKLLASDSRISVVSEALDKLVASAAYGAKLGGRSLVILDDLDKLCPEETELQVGNENSRARQISELVRSASQRMSRSSSCCSLLVTAQSKNSLNSVITQGHVFHETAELKAPNMADRRNILKQYVQQKYRSSDHVSSHESNLAALAGKPARSDDADLVKSSLPFASRLDQQVESEIDFLDLAGRTDGYMPGDLKLLVSRAQGEALSRCLALPPDSTSLRYRTEDFIAAFKDFTPSTLRNVTLQASSTKFDSVGGLQIARRTLVETLQYPTLYAPIFDRCPLRLRSGLLLYGYPGCGKTLLASAVAGECGLNFISVKGPEILNKYIGASEKSVRDLFERAAAAKPCILFFDEFDSIAPKRGHDSTGVTDRVVNQLLTQMDGAEGLSGVYVLAASSRPDLIDPALLRPGRLDKSLLCDMPTLEDRLDILRAVSKTLKVTSSVLSEDELRNTLREVAQRTSGYTGADLQAILYNAHLQAVRDVLDKHDAWTTAPQKQHTREKDGKVESLVDREILHFPFGHTGSDAPGSNPKQFELRARFEALDTKLRESKAAKRKERGNRRLGLEDETQSTGKDLDIIIEWGHIEKSLNATKSSLSREERIRFDRIYQEFQTARSGEMPSGQASREVGARSSLM